MARIMPLVSFPRNPRPAPTAPCRGVIFRRLIGSSKSCASSTAITASSPPSGAWPRANPGSKRPRKPRSRSPRRRALARKRRRKPLKCFNPRPVLARLKATRGRGMRTRKRAKPLHFARRPTIRSRSRLRQSARKVIAQAVAGSGVSMGGRARFGRLGEGRSSVGVRFR